MRPDVDSHSSWICRDEFERDRFLDLHARLVRANAAMLVLLVVVIGASFPFVAEWVAVLPAAAGMVLFGWIQRNTSRFSRPELWVFGALLGAEAMIVMAVAVSGGALTPAMALLCWPVAGVAGRFPDRASRLGTAYAATLATGAILLTDADAVASYPLGLSLLLVALVATHAVSTVLRDSDVEHRGASILDPLTGMLNRAALNRRTAEIEHQSRLTGEPVSVLVADLDGFKLVNDNHGHLVGDDVLRRVAQILLREVRTVDIVARYGGEEFVVVLPEQQLEGATAFAERVRQRVAEAPLVQEAGGRDPQSLTISIGLAAFPSLDVSTVEDLIARADEALYRAKASGRNRVFP